MFDLKKIIFQAIKSYKETEKSQWNESNSKVLERLRNIAFSDKSSLIRSVHVLDLSKDGYIKPHIDSVRVSCFSFLFYLVILILVLISLDTVNIM